MSKLAPPPGEVYVGLLEVAPLVNVTLMTGRIHQVCESILLAWCHHHVSEKRDFSTIFSQTHFLRLTHYQLIPLLDQTILLRMCDW